MQDHSRSLFTNPTRSMMSALVCGAVLFSAGAAHAATASKAPARDYQAARQACLNGQTYESKQVCLQEAAAAAAEAKKGNLTDTPDRYRQNALARCNALPPADRDACARRVEGGGKTSGSVAEGGIYRETVTIITEPAPAGSANANSQPSPSPHAPIDNTEAKPTPAAPEPLPTDRTPNRY